MESIKGNKALLIKRVFILISKVSLVLLIVLSALIISINKFWPDFTEKYKTEVADVFYPISEVFGSAAKGVGDYLKAVNNVLYANTIAERAGELEKENFKARLTIYSLTKENEYLKDKLNFIPEKAKEFYSARIISRTPGPIVNAAFIKSDKIEKIEKDNIVMNEDGLVGQIEAVADGVASVILITDKRSSLPVKSKNYGKRAILIGTGTKNPRLDYIISTNKLSLGEEILTSGDGGVFPPDIPIGYVKEINKGQVIIETYADWSALNYVFIIK